MLTVLASPQDTLNAASILPTIVGTVAGTAGVVAAVRTALAARRTDAALKDVTTQATLEERLDELSKSMRNSARLVEQVSSELEARAATAKRLKEEAETAEALAGLHKDQAEAVRRMLDAELVTTARRIRSDSIKIGVASFVAGGGLTFVVTLLVHPLH